MNELSNSIYERIQNQIDSVLDKLSQSYEDKLSENITNAIDDLNKLKSKIQTEYDELKRLSEWKKFSIAFYGETNAGKSTLIEALRLYFKEPTKLESQRKFKEFAQNYGLTEEDFEKVRQTILQSEQAIKEISKNIQTINQKYIGDISHSETEIRRLEELLQELKAKQPWWKHFWLILTFSRLPEEKSLLIEKRNLARLQASQKNELADIEEKLEQITQEKNHAESEEKRLKEQVEELRQFSDGQIIGDGRSDFTRDNTSFDFNFNGAEFTLIDVPGIEGDEHIVKKPIEEAVKKAHAVFYVTRTPKPPQTNEGDKGRIKGTLEKIEEHLGPQTEVWTIYNPSAKNPRVLEKPLLNEDDKKGLQALNEKLKEKLADKYQSHLVVSAKPSYLALSECIVPGSKESREKKKFFEALGNKETILEKSGLYSFVNTLSSDILQNYKEKIQRSNLNKARQVLDDSLEKLSIARETFKTSEQEINREIKNVQNQIKVLFEQFSGSLDSGNSKILREFQKNTQNIMYAEIDRDISNDYFKSELKETIQNQAQKIETQIADLIKKEADNFGNGVISVVERASTHLQNIMAHHNHSLEIHDFNMELKIDNGVSILDLVGSGFGLVTGIYFLASNPVGWSIAFVGGVVATLGALVGVAKSVRGFFDSDYKKSQQRKNTEKAIRDVSEKLKEKTTEILQQMKDEMNKHVQTVLSEVETPSRQLAELNQFLDNAYFELTSIQKTI
ncbi:hypothetical protein ACFBZI_10305 [Moraxella sp. ZJ142]|uniref:hypothetical protein n=1 Tax=Moraxella marmotae TaxID=3344520 RepID=UPI0035D4D264